MGLINRLPFGDNVILVKTEEDLGPVVDGKIICPIGKTLILCANITTDKTLVVKLTFFADVSEGLYSITSTASVIIEAPDLTRIQFVLVAFSGDGTNQAFDITGATVGPAEFALHTAIFTNVQSLGNIDDTSLVSMNLGTFSAFSEGLTINNGETVNIESFEWNASSGATNNTALSLSGTFTNLVDMLVNTFIMKGATNAGINIDSGASLQQVDINNCKIDDITGSTFYKSGSLEGDSIYISANNNGKLASSAAIGFMAMNGNTTSTAITTQNTFVDIAGTTTAGAIDERFNHGTSPNELTYTGLEDIKTEIHISIGGRRTSGSAARKIEVVLFRDTGSGYLAIPNAIGEIDYDSSTRVRSLAFSIGALLCTGDKIKVQVRNTEGTEDITIVNLIVSVR